MSFRYRRRTVQLLFYLAGLAVVSWFMPHYAAAALCAFVVLLVQAFRCLRRVKIAGRPVGIGWTRVLVACALFTLPSCILDNLASPGDRLCLSLTYDWQRADIVTQINHTPGDHLVIVRYSPLHRPLQEWVYNAAGIDRAKIVWAREFPASLSLRFSPITPSAKSGSSTPTPSRPCSHPTLLLPSKKSSDHMGD